MVLLFSKWFRAEIPSANAAILKLQLALFRWLEGIGLNFLVFWKGLNALPDMSSTDVSSCHFSSLPEQNNPSARDKEETWQGERSVKFILGSTIRPFQNTKKLCLTPSSHRDTACRSSKIAIFADGFSALNHFQKSMTVFLRAEMLDRLQFFLVKYKIKFPTSLSGLFRSEMNSVGVRR